MRLEREVGEPSHSKKGQATARLCVREHQSHELWRDGSGRLRCKEGIEKFPAQREVSVPTGAPPLCSNTLKGSKNIEQQKCCKLYYRIQIQDKIYPKVRNSKAQSHEKGAFA